MKRLVLIISIIVAGCFAAGPLQPVLTHNALAQSVACNGGEPYYCARDDRAIQPVTFFTPPAVNVPFVMPDFGERAVRVTGPNTMPSNPNDRYQANSADYYSQWGLFDASMCNGQGGYRFAVLQHSSGPLAYELCSKTMMTSQIVQLNFAQTGAQFSHIDPAAVYGMQGSVLTLYCYPDAGTSAAAYPVCANKAGTYTALYDFSTCPNLPAPMDSRYSDPPSQDATDRYFSDVLGDAQNSWGYLVRWDRTTGNCMWFDPARFLYGGTGIPPTPSPNGTPYSSFLSNPPTVTPEYTSGTMPAGTYTVGVTYSSYTWQYGVGESPLSATTQVTLTQTGGFTVTPPNCNDSFWCTGGGTVQYQPEYSVYACAGTSCTPTLQMYMQFTPAADGTTKSFTGTVNTTAFPSLVGAYDAIDGAGTWNFTKGDPWAYWATAFGYFGYSSLSYTWVGNTITMNFATAPPAGHNVWFRWSSTNNASNPNQPTPVTTTIATLVTNGPAAPTVATTAGGGGGIHTVAINPAGDRVFFETHGGSGGWNALFWNPATGAITGCNNYQSCSGHLAFGYSKFLGVQNSQSFSNDAISGNFNYGIAAIDSANSYSSLLTGPPNGTAAMDNGTQHLSWNNDLNGEDNEPACQGGSPAGGQDLAALTALDAEMFCFSPVTGHIWRFFHTRSTGAPYVGGAYQPTGPAFWHLTLGAQSQDGKYALLSDDWFGALGWTLLPNWTASAGETQGAEVVDPKGNLEVESAAGSCTTSATAITWPTTFNAVTSDGTCTWHLLGLVGQMFGGLNWTAANQGYGSGGYAGGVFIIDPNFNLELETTPNCYSGPTAPTWSTTFGGATTDNTCVWRNDGPSGLTFIPNPPETRTDVWVVEMK